LLSEEIRCRIARRCGCGFGEDLIAFATAVASWSADEHCSHRALLFYGRNECGLRHLSWPKYGVEGHVCARRAGDSDFRKLRHTAHPLGEVAGTFSLIWGRGENAAVSAYEWVNLPDDRMHVVKAFWSATTFKA
jgi:hypothetical protein